jgi:hypothetical protein
VSIRIKVILGTTRQRRFGDKPAHWICEEAKSHPDVEVEILWSARALKQAREAGH